MLCMSDREKYHTCYIVIEIKYILFDYDDTVISNILPSIGNSIKRVPLKEHSIEDQSRALKRVVSVLY